MNLRTYNTIMHKLTERINMCMVLGMADCAESFKIARSIVADAIRKESEDATPNAEPESYADALRAAFDRPSTANASAEAELDADIMNFLRDCISGGACE